MSGSLTVVGLGPARPEHVTLEAFQCLSRAKEHGDRVYGLPHARGMAIRLVPDLRVEPLEGWYAEEEPRSEVYRRLAEALFAEAFEEGRDVVYLVAGSPLFVNDAVLHLRRRCDGEGRPLRIVHGMSFLDLVLDRVYWTGRGGLQLYSAWNVARDGVRPSPEAPLLLFQLGESGPGSGALDPSGSPGILAGVRASLEPIYGGGHRVFVLYSSGHPAYRSLARATALDSLDAEPVPVYSNLWVPALAGPAAESETVPSLPLT